MKTHPMKTFKPCECINQTWDILAYNSRKAIKIVNITEIVSLFDKKRRKYLIFSWVTKDHNE